MSTAHPFGAELSRGLFPTVWYMPESVPELADHIANNVRAERGRRRWRQVDLAEHLGWTESAVTDLEIGRRRLLANDLPRLCAVFGISLAKLCDGADPKDIAAMQL